MDKPVLPTNHSCFETVEINARRLPLDFILEAVQEHCGARQFEPSTITVESVSEDKYEIDFCVMAYSQVHYDQIVSEHEAKMAAYEQWREDNAEEIAAEEARVLKVKRKLKNNELQKLLDDQNQLAEVIRLKQLEIDELDIDIPDQP